MTETKAQKAATRAAAKKATAGPPPTTTFTLSAEQHERFAKMLHLASKFADADEYRPVLTGVRIAIKDGVLTAEATDSYSLIRITSAGWGGVPDVPTKLVPAKWIRKCVPRRTRYGSATKWFFDGVSFGMKDADGLTYVAPCIEGDYPNVEKIIDGVSGSAPGAELVAFAPVQMARLYTSLTTFVPEIPFRWTSVSDGVPSRLDGDMPDLSIQVCVMPVRIPWPKQAAA